MSKRNIVDATAVTDAGAVDERERGIFCSIALGKISSYVPNRHSVISSYFAEIEEGIYTLDEPIPLWR